MYELNKTISLYFKNFNLNPTNVVAFSGNYGNSMDGRNQSVGRSESSSDEEEDEGEEGGQEEEQKDTASINQAEPEWKSTTGTMKPTTTDRSVTKCFTSSSVKSSNPGN